MQVYFCCRQPKSGLSKAHRDCDQPARRPRAGSDGLMGGTKNAYLLSLEAQIAEKQRLKKQKAEDERTQLDQRAAAPGCDRVNIFGSPSRGGGGEPLRDEHGRVVSGVRGLFQRELQGAPPGTAQPHGTDADGDFQGRGPSLAWRGGVRTSWGRGGLRNPNAGHNIFDESSTNLHGEQRKVLARGVGFDMAELPRPRTDHLRGPPDACRQHRWGRRSVTEAELPHHKWPDDSEAPAVSHHDEKETSYEQRCREYREQVAVRRQGHHQSFHSAVQHHQASDGVGTPNRPCSPPSPTLPPLACLSESPRACIPIISAISPDKRPSPGAKAAAVGDSEADVYRVWVEKLVLDRERLRQQLGDAGLHPCC